MHPNRVALVTGASRGIGKGIALALAECHLDLVVNYTSHQEAAEAVKSEASRHGVRAEVCQADISRRVDRLNLVDFVKETFGRIDVLVNNAGVAPDVREDMLQSS